MITVEPKTIRKEFHGPSSRFCIDVFLTRFNTTEFFVRDAEVPDKAGYSTVVYQTSNYQAACNYIKSH